MVQLRVRVQFQLRVEFRVRVQLKLGMKFRVRVQLMVRVLFGVRIKFRVSVKFRKELVQGELRLPTTVKIFCDFYCLRTSTGQVWAKRLYIVPTRTRVSIGSIHIFWPYSQYEFRTSPERPCIDSIQLSTGQNFGVRIFFCLIIISV